MKKDSKIKGAVTRKQFLNFVKKQKSRYKTPGDFRAKWSEYELRKVRNAIDSYKNTIIQIPGVNGISYSPKLVSKTTPGGFEITIHTEPALYKKIRSRREIPKDLEGFPVKVVPTKSQLGSCPGMDNARYGLLTPGVNIGPFNGCGSLGVFVWYQNQSYEASLVNRFFLSAWHVLTSIGTLSQPTIFQPGGADIKEDSIGFVWDAPPPRDIKSAFDAGIVKIDYAYPAYGRLESIGHQIFEKPYIPYT